LTFSGHQSGPHDRESRPDDNVNDVPLSRYSPEIPARFFREPFKRILPPPPIVAAR
jgi:hypothetical protein